MATITKSASAPSGDISLSAGQVTFTLNTTTTSYETEDQAVVSAALGSSYFDVEIPEPPVEDGQVAPDPNDPRLNRSADHLSAVASPEAIKAAAANEAAIRAVSVVAGAVASTDPAPTVAQALAEQFVSTGTDTGPVVPNGESTPGTVAPEPAPAATTSPASESSASGSSSSAPSTSTGASS